MYLKNRLTAVLAVFMVLISICPISAKGYMEYVPPSDELAYKEDYVLIDFGNGKSSNMHIVYINGRLCVPLDESAKMLGAVYTENSIGTYITYKGKKALINRAGKRNLRIVTAKYKDKEYISLYELLEPFELVPVVDTRYQKISIEKNTASGSNKLYKLSGKGNAYIRLEDVVADGLDKAVTSNYTTENIEKLRYTAQYLYECGAKYYVAFIPLYKNGKTGYTNDLTKDFNLYNSYFLYVMDYMADHNGKIGAHGYTHQYGDYISAEGYEWGKDTPFSLEEQNKRLVLARRVIERLGYKADFFEFPHYGATEQQLEMAEKYYDMIYQYYNSQKLLNRLTYTARSGKKVYYLPTPAEYVKHRGDKPGILERLQACITNGYTMSLFYHPVIDINYISVESVNGCRVWSYSQDGILPAIVKFMQEKGYSFITL